MSKSISNFAFFAVVFGLATSGYWLPYAQTGVPNRALPELRTNAAGYSVPPKVVMSEKYKPFWIQHAVSGFSKDTSLETPAHLEILRHSENCAVTRPSEHEYIANVHTGSAWNNIDIFSISEEKLNAYSKTYAKIQQEWDIGYVRKKVRAGTQFWTADVIVGQSDKPVYLVLASETAMVWNIVKAPETKISRVVLLGNYGVGVSNLADEVPVEVIAGSALAVCGGHVALQPKPHWPLYDSTGNRRKLLNRYKDDYRQFNRWFQNTLGVSVDTNLVAVRSANHFYVGEATPGQADKFPYKYVTDSKVRAYSDDRLTISNWKAVNQMFLSEIKKRSNRL